MTQTVRRDRVAAQVTGTCVIRALLDPVWMRSARARGKGRQVTRITQQTADPPVATAIVISAPLQWSYYIKEYCPLSARAVSFANQIRTGLAACSFVLRLSNFLLTRVICPLC